MMITSSLVACALVLWVLKTSSSSFRIVYVAAMWHHNRRRRPKTHTKKTKKKRHRIRVVHQLSFRVRYFVAAELVKIAVDHSGLHLSSTRTVDGPQQQQWQ